MHSRLQWHCPIHRVVAAMRIPNGGVRFENRIGFDVLAHVNVGRNATNGALRHLREDVASIVGVFQFSASQAVLRGSMNCAESVDWLRLCLVDVAASHRL